MGERDLGRAANNALLLQVTNAIEWAVVSSAYVCWRTTVTWLSRLTTRHAAAAVCAANPLTCLNRLCKALDCTTLQNFHLQFWYYKLCLFILAAVTNINLDQIAHHVRSFPSSSVAVGRVRSDGDILQVNERRPRRHRRKFWIDCGSLDLLYRSLTFDIWNSVALPFEKGADQKPLLWAS